MVPFSLEVRNNWYKSKLLGRFYGINISKNIESTTNKMIIIFFSNIAAKDESLTDHVSENIEIFNNKICA